MHIHLYELKENEGNERDSGRVGNTDLTATKSFHVFWQSHGS